jgi:hypothetical protein
VARETDMTGREPVPGELTLAREDLTAGLDGYRRLGIDDLIIGLRPVTVQRRVSSRGGLMVARQKIHAGMIHAGKTATVICENNCFRVVIDGDTAAVVPRTTTSEIHRYKANATDKHTQARLTQKDSDPPCPK